MRYGRRAADEVPRGGADAVRRGRCGAAGPVRGGADAGEMWCASRSLGNGSRNADYELEVKCQYSGRKV